MNNSNLPSNGPARQFTRTLEEEKRWREKFLPPGADPHNHFVLLGYEGHSRCDDEEMKPYPFSSIEIAQVKESLHADEETSPASPDLPQPGEFTETDRHEVCSADRLNGNMPPHDEETVILDEDTLEPVVLGERVPRISLAQHFIVKALLTAAPSLLTRPELEQALAREGVATPASVTRPLGHLCDAHANWQAVLKRPGRGRREGYGIRKRHSEPPASD